MARVHADETQRAPLIMDPEHLVLTPGDLRGRGNPRPGSGVRGLKGASGLSHPWLIYYDAKIRLQGGGKQS